MLLCVIALLCFVVLLCDIVLLLCYWGIRWLRANRRAGPANGSTRMNCAKCSMRSIINLGFGRAFVLYRRADVVRGMGFVL